MKASKKRNAYMYILSERYKCCAVQRGQISEDTLYSTVEVLFSNAQLNKNAMEMERLLDFYSTLLNRISDLCCQYCNS